jgi:hypothetical protein
VSPVRHTHAGFIENTRSKSVLFTAIDQLQQNFPKLKYFPSYEIVMDELRDYRFFADDLVHPNHLAKNRVWDYFKETFFSETTKSILVEITKLQQAVGHRAFFPESKEHYHFLKKTLQKVSDFQVKHPYINLQKERAALELHLSRF